MLPSSFSRLSAMGRSKHMRRKRRTPEEENPTGWAPPPRETPPSEDAFRRRAQRRGVAEDPAFRALRCSSDTAGGKVRRCARYYQLQQIVSEKDWPLFFKTLHHPLPLSFRFSASPELADAVSGSSTYECRAFLS